MNGRTAQDNRLPVNGDIAANGTTGHASQPLRTTEQADAESSQQEGSQQFSPGEWRPDQQIARIELDPQTGPTQTGPAQSGPTQTGSMQTGPMQPEVTPTGPAPAEAKTRKKQAAQKRTGQQPTAPTEPPQPNEIRVDQNRVDEDRPDQNRADENESDEDKSQLDPAPHSDWLSEVRDRPRVPNGATLRQFNTPVRVDEIAVAAMRLAEDLHAATQTMPESVELRRFRRDLDQAANTFREIASKLEVTAGKLVRLAANEGQVCGVGWGVCPEHGLTLMNLGETPTCHVLGCGRPNEGELERCEHPVAYRVVDAAGPALLTCAGHAVACRLYFDNPVITAAADSMELF